MSARGCCVELGSVYPFDNDQLEVSGVRPMGKAPGFEEKSVVETGLLRVAWEGAPKHLSLSPATKINPCCSILVPGVVALSLTPGPMVMERLAVPGDPLSDGEPPAVPG